MIKLKRGENVWVSYTKQKVFRQNNCMNLVITGMPGTGKTYAMLGYFCLIDPDFELDNNFFFRAIDLMKNLKEGRFKRGKIWGYDEAGIDGNNMNYQSVIAKGLNALFQTARHRNYVFGLTLPHLSMLTKGVRTLMTAHWVAEGWNRDSKNVIVPRSLEYNGDLDKFYRKRLVVVNGGDVSLCNRILLPKPRKKLLREYEKLKKEFTQDLYERVYGDMLAFHNKEENKNKNHFFTDREEVVIGKLKEGKVVKDIMVDLDCSKANVYQIMKQLVNKGIVIKGVKDDNSSIISYIVEDKRDV